MSLFVLFHRPGPAWQPGVDFPAQDGIMDHIVFMRRLDDEGRLLLGGPFDDEPAGPADGGPVGIAIIEADSLQEAKRLAESDRSVQAGLLTFRARPWRPRMGSALPSEGASGAR
ncbi:MAG TPA: YciI family protein [Candidatus Limnocylindria bacterium]